jgi:hypothetical protein
MTQSQCPVFFSLILVIYFKNSNVLVISRRQWLILGEGEMTLNI